MKKYELNNILEHAAKLKKENKNVALATVISTWGSSPRPVGSQLLIEEDGNFLGSVSGGCIEGDVVEMALSTIKDGQIRLLEFGVTNEKAWESGLACGGQIKIFVELIE